MGQKAKRITCYVAFRVLLPLILLGAAVIRFNGFSLAYLCLVLAAPLLPNPTPASIAGKTGNYLLTCLVVTSTTLLAQVMFQAYLLIIATETHPYGSVLKPCSLLERYSSPLETYLRQLGLQRLEPNSYDNILIIVLPDVCAFLASLLVFVVCRRLVPPYRPVPRARLQRQQSIIRQRLESYGTYILNILGNFLIALFLALSGVANPSALCAVYFLSFLGVATWWATYHSLGRRFAGVRVALLVYSAAHLLLLYVYQLQVFQDVESYKGLRARVLGLTALVHTDCRKPWVTEMNPDAPWWMYVSPALVLVLYFTLACEIRRWASRITEVPVQPSSRRHLHSPTHSANSSRGSVLSRRRTGSASSERQVVPGHGTDVASGDHDDAAAPSQALVDTRPTSYNSTDGAGADNASISPHSDIYTLGEAPDGATGGTAQTRKIRSPVVSLFVYIMKQSYVATLIIMMVWSITYHSWLTFVFLLSACIVWMVPHKRSVCLRLAPVIVGYAECLLIVQYIYGFNLKDELPTETPGGYSFNQIGLMMFDNPCVHLTVQMAFTVVFFLTLRQYMRERHLAREDYYMEGLRLQQMELSDGDAEGGVRAAPTTPTAATSAAIGSTPLTMGDVIDGQDSDTIKALGTWVWRMMCKYWIVVCAVLLLVISITEPVIYRIIYMVFFMYFIVTYQMCQRWWRFSVYVFWWIVVVYSMVVLLCIYTYQFENFPEYWMNATHLDETDLSDLGLEIFSTATLFAKLLTPTSFVIIVCMQVHYFQKPFLVLSDINRFRPDPSRPPEDPILSPSGGEGTSGGNAPPTPAATSSEDVVDRSQESETDGAQQKFVPLKTRLWRWTKRTTLQLYALLDRASVLMWRLLDIHITKVVMFTIFMCCVTEVAALNVPFVFVVAVFMPVPGFQSVMSHLCQVYAGLAILAKMLYQLQFVTKEHVESNCTVVLNVNHSGDLPYPFNQTIDNAAYIGLKKVDNLPSYLQNYVLIVVILAFEAIVRNHESQYYNRPGKARPPLGIVFRTTRRENADDGLVACCKFFVNYTFYKFGLQICLMMTMVTMVVRLDVYSVIYGIFLGVLLCLRRRQAYYMWPAYIIVLLVLLVMQYLSCLGVPPGLCWGYPWDIIQPITRNLKIYLFLPNYIESPDSYLLIADFFQLLFVCLQWSVFRIETSEDCQRYGGGSNRSVLPAVEAGDPNPVQDFLYSKSSYLDYIKLGIFHYSFWFTLIILFVAGTAKISLFCFGYLVGFFFFLWFGMELLTKPLRKVIKMWGILLGYNFFVILSKSCLQLVGCVYLSKVANGFCWVIQLLGLACLRAGNYVYAEEEAILADCKQSEDDAGLTWDAICFILLLLQLRIYKSHYFRHVVMELEVQNQFSSRGAELINMRLIRAVADQKRRERDTLEQIKRKMERIRLRQERLQQKALLDSKDHYIVIRSGDYYMFDEDDEDETESSMDLDTLDRLEDSDDDEKTGPLKILNAAMTGGTRRALKEIERQKTISESDGSKTPATPKRTSGLSPVPESSTDTVDAADGAPSVFPRRPSTDHGTEGSEDEIGDMEGNEEEDEKQETCCQKFTNGLRILCAFIRSVIDSVITVLRKISYEYRTVSHILDKEKEAEKRRRREASLPVLPSDTVTPDVDPDVTREEEHRDLMQRRHTDVVIRVFTTDAEGSQDMGSQRSLEDPSAPRSEQEFRRHMPRLLQLLFAVIEAIMSRSEMLCYFAMILNMLINASLLSLLYPISVFLWAMLSVPRPSKKYWITIITYTEAVVVVKYLFQFGFFPWNDSVSQTVESTDPFWPPRIIGIEKKDRYAAFDLVLLFCLFIHRSILKRHGLWKDSIDIDADFAKAEGKIASTSNTPTTSPTIKLRSAASTDPDPDRLGAYNATYETSPDNSRTDLATMETAAEEEDEGHQRGCCASCWRPVLDFYRQMTNTRYNAVADVYALMFFCDFIAFLIIVFGYSAFGPMDSTGAAGTELVATVIQNNRVPAPFLAMLLVQFVLIIVDRALYLRKNIFGKFLFQITLVIIVHVWMFIILPAVTKRSFTENVPAQLWYFIKCVYFGLSAYQIRSGYPTRILGNFLTKHYNYINLFLFKGFLLIPFLLELRALMDWMWTDTTLALSSWLKMEDIYASIFELKCWRWAENKYPTPRGEPRKKVVKYSVGGLLLFLLIFIIWFPLLLFSLASAVFKPNPPVYCSLEMVFAGYQPIFSMTAQQETLQVMTDQQYAKLKGQFIQSNHSANANAFLSSYQASDVYVAHLDGISTATWEISPPSVERLRVELLKSSLDINLLTTVSFIREPKSGMTSDLVSTQFVKILKASEHMDIRRSLANMVNGSQEDPVLIRSVFPPYIQVPVDGKPTAALPMLGATNDSWSNVSLQLVRSDDAMWWQLKEVDDRGHRELTLELTSFNERVAPGALNILTSYGIMGLYISFVFVIGQVTRKYLIGNVGQIMFVEMPRVTSIYNLCLEIYLVRESREFILEEQLYSKLLFLYRSPETLIRWTKTKIKNE